MAGPKKPIAEAPYFARRRIPAEMPVAHCVAAILRAFTARETGLSVTIFTVTFRRT
jgi:hypothetical protein